MFRYTVQNSYRRPIPVDTPVVTCRQFQIATYASRNSKPRPIREITWPIFSLEINQNFRKRECKSSNTTWKYSIFEVTQRPSKFIQLIYKIFSEINTDSFHIMIIIGFSGTLYSIHNLKSWSLRLFEDVVEKKKSRCNTDYRVTNYTFISGTLEKTSSTIERDRYTRSLLASWTVHLGVQRVQGDFRSASANIDTVDMQVHTRELPSDRVSLLTTDSSGFSDINVGKHDFHSLNAELRSPLDSVVAGCCLLKIESYIFRKGTRESIYVASSNPLTEGTKTIGSK